MPYSCATSEQFCRSLGRPSLIRALTTAALVPAPLKVLVTVLAQAIIGDQIEAITAKIKVRHEIRLRHNLQNKLCFD